MRKLNVVIYIAAGGLLTMVTAWAFQTGGSDHDASSDAADTTAEADDISIRAQNTSKFPVTIRKPEPPAGVATGLVDHHGNAVLLECRSCHDIRKPDLKLAASAQLNEFHQGLVFDHGQLACASCHNAGDGYTTLHLADGSAVEYADTMTLCAQCHGPQFRDYQHGSHGGMTGYWDLSRGPRTRNHCIDCHDPHSPQFPVVLPARGPNDRFLPVNGDTDH